MNRYCIKCRSGKIEYFDVISENEEGFNIRLTRLSEGNEKIFEEFMTRQLFNICMKTGYIFQLEKSALTVA